MAPSARLTLEPVSRRKLQDWQSTGRENFGLVVGRWGCRGPDGRVADAAVFLAPTLPPREDEAAVEEDDDVSGSSDAGPPPEKTIDPVHIRLDELTSDWVRHHAHQLSRLLVGGLDVIGVFVVADVGTFKRRVDELKTYATLLAKLRRKRKTRLRLGRHEGAGKDEGVRYVIHADATKGGTISCLSIEASPESTAESTFKPVDVEYRDFMSSWSRIDATFGVDATIHVPHEDLDRLALDKQIHRGLAQTVDRLLGAKIVLFPADETSTSISIPSGTSSLIPETDIRSSGKPSGRKGGRKGQQDQPTLDSLKGKRFGAKIFIGSKSNSVDASSGDEEASRTSCSTRLVIKGTMCTRAHVPSRATVEESIAALKSDMIHSLLTRVDLLCDDMVTESEAETRPEEAVVYQLPRRVFAPLRRADEGFGVNVADFLFADETMGECVERIREVTGHDVQEDALDLTAETLAPLSPSPASSLESLSAAVLPVAASAASSSDFLRASADVVIRHRVSLFCVAGALAALFSAYLQIEGAL